MRWQAFVRKWWLPIGLPAIAAIVSVLWWVNSLERTMWNASGSLEGYWFAAQYQIAFGRVREEVRAAAAGEAVDPDLVALRADILRSRMSLLNDPSDVKVYYNDVQGFSETATRLAEFDRTTLSRLPGALAYRDTAAQLLQEFKAHEKTVSQLSHLVRGEEVRARQSSLHAYATRRKLGLMIVGAVAFVLVGMLVRLLFQAERERQLKQDREAALVAAQVAVKAKNLFLGMVSHELRSPLQGIVSGLDLLEADAGGSRLIQGIRRDADALNAQLADLLTLAKGEAGRLEVRPEAFEAGDLVVDLAERHGEHARAKGLGFAVTVPDEPVFVVADHARIAQCLNNVIANAVKYTDAGQVKIRLLPYDESLRSLRFEVCDTGPGLPPEVNFHGHAPFQLFQWPAASGGGRSGAGIGLAIVHLIVNHLGGLVTLERPPDGGTVFRIDIPAVPSEAGEAQSAGCDTVQMLVVDDRSDVLEGLAAVARQSGFDCEQALSAAIAANMLAAKRYDVVLIDLCMPVKSGDDLAAETRRGGGCNSRTPMIAISAAGEPPPGDPRMAAFNGYLSKPIGQRALKAALGKVVGQAGSVVQASTAPAA